MVVEWIHVLVDGACVACSNYFLDFLLYRLRICKYDFGKEIMTDKIYNSDVLAGDILLLAHQGLPDEQETVFTIEYFQRAVADAWAGILRQQYLDAYKQLRSDGDLYASFVQFDQQWLKGEQVEVSKDEESGLWKAELKGKVLTFPFDRSSIGFQDVRSTKFGACNLVRAKPSIYWKLKHQPETNVTYWWPEQGSIFLTKECCKNLQIFYVPELDEEFDIDRGAAEQIKQQVLNVYFSAKKSTVPDLTNNSNPIAELNTEADKQTLKQ
jgi:hypothetical protein